MKKIYLVTIIFLCVFPGKTSAQCATPSLVPYYQDFQSISVNNQLPSCWAISNPSACLTFTTGASAKYAAFALAQTGNNYFYSNAIQLIAGITYSMSSWYQISIFGSGNGWTEFSMLLGSTQSTNGLVAVATVTNPAISNVYTLLSNTFVVQSTGLYYAAVKATSNGSGNHFYFYWDDFLISLPCSAAYNSPLIGLTTYSTTICEGKPVTITATGAHTYSWNTGAIGASIVDFPFLNFNYVVSGTNTLTGCIATASVLVAVKPSPVVTIIAPVPLGQSNPVMCLGAPTMNLTANGAPQFVWNTGQQTISIAVSPSVTTGYTVTGTNTDGCATSSSVLVTVNPLPIISVSGVGPISCVGETATLVASGATSYQWSNNTGLFLVGNLITFLPSTTSSTFNITGTDDNNCVGATSFILYVNDCTGFNDQSLDDRSSKIYPNPGTGEFILETAHADLKTIVVTDLYGKIVFEAYDTASKSKLNLNHLSNGVYLLKVYNLKQVSHLKFLKE